MSGQLCWWVGLWNRREAPTSLALVRIAISLVLLWDLAMVAWHDLPVLLWAAPEHGGMLDAANASRSPLLYRVLPATPTVAWGLWGVLVASIASFGAGFLTRSAGVVFVFTYAQTALINSTTDRGIDTLVRIMILILVFSGCGRGWSVDARFRTGRWQGSGEPILSWPRYLVVIQLVLMYWGAGMEKFAVTWFPWGGYSALYLILQDPILATRDWSWLAHPPLYQLTQFGTAVSHLWELTSPVLLLAYHFRDGVDRPGRIAQFFNRFRVRDIYVALGFTFHVMIAITLRLGIFPFAMLALYPAFFHPDELESAGRRLRRRFSRPDQAVAAPTTTS